MPGRFFRSNTTATIIKINTITTTIITMSISNPNPLRIANCCSVFFPLSISPPLPVELINTVATNSFVGSLSPIAFTAIIL